jgi:enamine deaminase RidA (YjgF/YER057c/UK114 family)
VVKVTVFVTDMSQLPTIIALRRRYFTVPYPTDSLVKVRALTPGTPDRDRGDCRSERDAPVVAQLRTDGPQNDIPGGKIRAQPEKTPSVGSRCPRPTVDATPWALGVDAWLPARAFLKRTTRLELATFGLGSRRSTN